MGAHRKHLTWARGVPRSSNDPIPGVAALPLSCPLRSCQRLPGLTLLLGTGTKPRLRPSRGCRAELGARFSRAPPAPAQRRPSPPPGRRAGRARATAAGAASPVGAAGDTGGELAEGSWPRTGELPCGAWTWQRRCQPRAQPRRGSAKGFLLPAFFLVPAAGSRWDRHSEGGDPSPPAH